MREWTERHILELIHKVWGDLKKDLKSGSGKDLKSELTGVKLKLYTNLYTHVEPPIAGYQGLMARLIIKQIPFEVTNVIKENGFKSTYRNHGTVIKLSFQDRYRWQTYLKNSIPADKPEFIVYQPVVGYGGGVIVKQDTSHPILNWFYNIFSGNKGLVPTQDTSISGPVVFYSFDPIKGELYNPIEVNQKTHISDSFNGYTVLAGTSEILSWKFPQIPVTDDIWAFQGFPTSDIPKDFLVKVMAEFKSEQASNDIYNYIINEIDLGEYNNETNK